MSQHADKPHIIFIATRVPFPPVTGHYLRTWHILRGLAQRYTVHFFGFWDKHATGQECARAEQALKTICASVYAETVGAERSTAHLAWDLLASLLTARPFIDTKYFSRNMREAIQSAVADYQIAIVHADSLPSGQYLLDLSLPRLLTNHNVEYRRLQRHAAQRRPSPYGAFLRFQAWLTRRYERRILGAIGNCVTVSEDDRQLLRELAPHVRFFLVPNGTDTSAPALPPADLAARSALWVGGMNDTFNREGVLHFASRILPRIRERVAGFQWIVVGRDPPALLKELAGDPSSGVVLTGFVPTLREVYERAAIVVVPLISGGGTKLKVLEAMAMGRAVVTTPVGAEGIGVRDGIEMEIASTEEDFAQRVAVLLKDAQRRERMASAARALAERDHAWEVINERMLYAMEAMIRAQSQGTLAACAE